MAIDIRYPVSGLGSTEPAFSRALHELEKKDVIARIWQKDHTVWKTKDDEISNRLGWLETPEKAASLLASYEVFARELVRDGFSSALLLGMGGSSLAPEVFGRVFGSRKDRLELRVLDSTDPEAVRRAAAWFPPESTLFIVSSKSGTTLETTSLFNYFYTRVREHWHRRPIGRCFAAVTDAGSPLEQSALRLRFRRIFHGDPECGGRFSVFTAFGLLPAALLGLDSARLVTAGRQMAGLCRNADIQKNPGARLGAWLGASALAGRDKAVFLLSPGLESFGAWLEQLIAESTGKEGKGILPIVRDPIVAPVPSAKDLCFVHLGLAGDKTHDGFVSRLKKKGAPLISFRLDDVYDLGGLFFLWEMAVGVAGSVLRVNPFNQPNVAASKKKTEAVLRLQNKGEPALGRRPTSAADIRLFLGQAKPGDYLGIQAFLPPTRAVSEALREFAVRLRAKTLLPVVYDFGPRFLHSTGQLHKGDRGNGLFIQLTAAHRRDLAVPSAPGRSRSSFSFGALEDAQALGDREALMERGRRLLHIHLKTVPGDIRRLLPPP
jgi:transaldolase / glucose-6-phosphate isomerase